MDYEKKYNEALNWMRELYPGLHGATKEDAEHYFPELIRDEDERIRKSIIDVIQRAGFISSEYKYEAIAWLEKQKEQEPITINQDEKEFLADEITAFLCNYDKEFDGEDPVPSEVAEHFYLLGKQAQKQKPVKRSLEDDHIIGFVYDLLNEIEWKDNWAMSKDECLRLLNNYSPQKPAEWSEEDEMMRNALWNLLHLHYAQDNARTLVGIEAGKFRSWLKSLRPQSHWKPSEEQMEALSETIAFAPDTFKPKCTLVTLQDDLKKLREE